MGRGARARAGRPPAAGRDGRNSRPAPAWRQAGRARREIARLTRRVEDEARHRAETLEQQTATAEVLRVIASAPAEIQTVLATIAERAAQLLHASDCFIYRVEGTEGVLAAYHGPLTNPRSDIGVRHSIHNGTVPANAILQRQTTYCPDARVDFPTSGAVQHGLRSMLAAPLLRDGAPIGAIYLRSPEVDAFSAGQMGLLETFADQAVIAIENTGCSPSCRTATGR